MTFSWVNFQKAKFHEFREIEILLLDLGDLDVFQSCTTCAFGQASFFSIINLAGIVSMDEVDPVLMKFQISISFFFF